MKRLVLMSLVVGLLGVPVYAHAQQAAPYWRDRLLNPPGEAPAGPGFNGLVFESVPPSVPGGPYGYQWSTPPRAGRAR